MWQILVAGIVRSVLGWLENSIKDGKITKFELKELLSTIIRVGLIGLSSYYLGADPTTAGAIGVVGDIGLYTVKKSLQKKPTVMITTTKKK